MNDIPQTRYLGIMLLAAGIGFFLGLFGDLIRIRRAVCLTDADGIGKERGKPERVAEFFEDVLFFAFSGAVFSVFFFVTNEGRVRWFALLFGFLGFLAYRASLSRLFLPAAMFLIRIAKKGLRWFRNRILLPLLHLLGGTLKKMLQIVTYFVNIFAYFFDKLKRKRETEKKMREILASAERPFI